jgi:hypothetical protein
MSQLVPPIQPKGDELGVVWVDRYYDPGDQCPER